MKISIKTVVLVAVLLFGVAVLLPSSDTFAQASQIRDGISDVSDGEARPLSEVIKTAVDVLLYFIGALSVIMIIYGGFRYVTSGGESSGVQSAKNTILYAVIGLIVSVLAFAIANFAVGLFDESNANDPNGCNGTADPARPECASS